ncbi:helix-hairpin-helix domain-containing protein [Cryobacterium sp. SO1]|uniref:helix-hairpin-helix domain-containing protein n=1 Tax=Cryobacterium sp. SO1 TaxID=1897061 RepID=UPI001022BFF3|nr:helix-hairpin-helix domain-containing protein [Cryobacterium sp. SO1]RZI35207.1 hypothetical protein BJQ95_02408 [Cryobacterium sp. SO1]
MGEDAGRAVGAAEVPGRAGDADGTLWVEQGIPAPARRALVAAGILTVEDLCRADPDVLARLHGMGPKALARLRPLCDG